MKKIIIAIVLSVFMQSVFAANKNMSVVPSGWKLENYFGDSLVVFFSGSSCTNGRLSFPSNATVDDKNRFWSLILSAKATNSKVFVIYQDNSNCTLVSFASID
ncbi:hypothetical protein [Shewanella woodyi]|uniref:hypothetical protein n=1 Tax=Shewanella woodyi TaxID=60961 RepID=UPI0007F8DD5F|nr:hypothetical protein [Shewanella woodyi]